MKFIISEDRIYDLVMKHIDNMFDVKNINYVNATDDYGNDLPAFSFYLYDYDDDINLFRWYDKGYFENDESSHHHPQHLKKWIEDSPILSFDSDGKKEQLDSLFGDKWYQPFKDWFLNNFDLPIKTIE
jgi:hypothetical protein